MALQRVANEVAMKHLSSKSAEPTLRVAGVNRDPLAPLVTIDGGRSNVVELSSLNVEVADFPQKYGLDPIVGSPSICEVLTKGN